jgi:SAM-dependent methyltransferase
VTTAYAGLAHVWASDATLVYGPLAEHLVARAPMRLHGCRALDAGAGSGVAGDALRAAGSRVVAVDLEPDMAAYAARPSVAADVTALPFRAGSFDLAVAAFVVNHLADPAAGLAELRRVVRPGGAVLASAFSVDRAAAKAAVDEVAAAYGCVTSPWYDELQRRAAGVGTVSAMTAALRAAGFGEVDVAERSLDVGLADPADVVRYRLALPHLHAFVDALDAARGRQFVADATAAVAASGTRFAPYVLEAVAVR